MKKPYVSLMSLALVLPSLFSCGNTEETAVEMPFGQMYDSSLSSNERLIDLEYGLLDDYIANEKTFALLVQGDDSSCVCYYDFLAALDGYIEENDARIYHIEKEELIDTHGIKIQSNANAIAVFKEGKLAKQYLFKDSDKIVKDQDAFEKKLDSLMGWNVKAKYVSRTQLDSLYDSSVAGFTVLFMRETCSDCAFMNYAFFEDYAINLKDSLYIFDLDSIKKEGDEAYSSFKDEYGLSSKYSEYGYGDGVVPTFQYIVPGKAEHKASLIKDAAIYLNDTLSMENGEYKIISTYWDDTRYHEFLDGRSFEKNLLGKTIPSSDVHNGRWDNQKANDYHRLIIEEFVKFYIGLNE